MKMDEETKWATVEWLSSQEGPDLVHLDELEVVRMYPQVGGLKEPVRKYEDTFSAVTVLREMFYPDDGGLPEQVRDYDDTKGVAALLKKEFFEKE